MGRSLGLYGPAPGAPVNVCCESGTGVMAILANKCWPATVPLIGAIGALAGAEVAWVLFLVCFDQRWLEDRFLDGRAALRRVRVVTAITLIGQAVAATLLALTWTLLNATAYAAVALYVHGTGVVGGVG